LCWARSSSCPVSFAVSSKSRANSRIANQGRPIIASTLCLGGQFPRFRVQLLQLGKEVVGLRDVLGSFRLDQQFRQVVALVPKNRVWAYREILRYAAIRSVIGY
jgi:hypothetical protein